MYLKGIKYYWTKILVFALAFQILNLSVHSGAQMTMAHSLSTIGASNQIDCFLEYFYEDICNLQGYNDVFDTGLHNKSAGSHKFVPKLLDIQMPMQRMVVVSKTNFRISKQNHFPLWDNKYDYLFALEITPPPPKRNIGC